MQELIAQFAKDTAAKTQLQGMWDSETKNNEEISRQLWDKNRRFLENEKEESTLTDSHEPPSMFVELDKTWDEQIAERISKRQRRPKSAPAIGSQKTNAGTTMRSNTTPPPATQKPTEEMHKTKRNNRRQPKNQLNASPAMGPQNHRATLCSRNTLKQYNQTIHQRQPQLHVRRNSPRVHKTSYHRQAHP